MEDSLSDNRHILSVRADDQPVNHIDLFELRARASEARLAGLKTMEVDPVTLCGILLSREFALDDAITLRRERGDKI